MSKKIICRANSLKRVVDTTIRVSFISACCARPEKMTEKRTLAQDEFPSAKNCDSQGMKRRKLLHDDAQSQSPKRTRSKVSGKQKGSQAQEEVLEPSRGPVESKELASEAFEPSQDLVLQDEPRNTHSRKWSITHCTSGRFLNMDPLFTSDGR